MPPKVISSLLGLLVLLTLFLGTIHIINFQYENKVSLKSFRVNLYQAPLPHLKLLPGVGDKKARMILLIRKPERGIIEILREAKVTETNIEKILQSGHLIQP